MDNRIRNKIFSTFNVSHFKKGYYCEKLTFWQLKDKLNELYPDRQILFRVDHIVLVGNNGKLKVLYLDSHNAHKCAKLH